MTGRVRGDGYVFDIDCRSPQSIQAAGFAIGSGCRFIEDGLRLTGAASSWLARGPAYGSVCAPPFGPSTAFWWRFRFRPQVPYDSSDDGYLFDTTQIYYGPRITRDTGVVTVFPSGSGGVNQTFNLTAEMWQVGVETEWVVYWDPASCIKVWVDGVQVVNYSTTWSPYYGETVEIAVGASVTGTHAETIDLLRVQAGSGTLTADELADLVAGDETEELRPENALIWLPFRRQYGAGSAGDPKRTPNLGSLGAACDPYLGDNGQGGTDEPTILSPHGYSFDGGDYLTVSAHASLRFGDGAGTDYPFSVAMLLDGLNTASAPGYVGRTGRAILYGDLNIYNSTHIVTALADYRQNGAYISGYANQQAIASGLDKGARVPFVMTYDGSKTSAGIKHYYNGEAKTMTPDTSGSYAGCGDNATDLMIAKCATVLLNGKMREFAIFPFELTPRQVKILSAQMRARANV